MIHGAVAFGLLLHVLFWGAGAALLAMPRRWARFWPVLTVPAGLALQSAVVWAGAHAGLAGTDRYAWGSELIPAALLAWALRRHGLRRARTDLARVGLVWAATAGCLALLVLPVALASRGLTTLSLGSCDAADYAAGARVLKEFAAGDRGGFLGLAEVVRVQSVDNVFDYWIRLNHFTPAALLALNGTVLDCAPHELATLLTAVLLAGLVPTVFWMARAVFGYSGGVSLLVAALFGVSPAMWYAVAHVAPGQLLAAQAIAWLTWAGLALWRTLGTAVGGGRAGWRCGLPFAGVLGAAYWLVLGSYNFILLVALVPAGTYVLGRALRGRTGARLHRWWLLMLAPLVLVAVPAWPRMAGLAERFALLQTYDFGWRIPAFTPEGWLGMVQGGSLAPWDFYGVRWVLAGAVAVLLAWSFGRALRQRTPAVWTALAVAAPVLAGYAFLQGRGAWAGTNASYDAYKLFAVFYPLLLPAFCWWVTLRRSRRLHEWLFVWGIAGAVGLFNAAACGMFVWQLSRAPLAVDGDLRSLRKIEAMPDVTSVNLLIPDMWSRLWANAFLLREEQYFRTHTYEGRRGTPLRGTWDLEGGLVAVYPGGGDAGAARRTVTPRFALVDTRHAAFVRVELPERGGGWHDDETDPRGGGRWRWTAAPAELRVENPHAYPVTLDVTLDGWSPVARQVALELAGGERRPGAEVRPQRQEVKLPALTVPPGVSKLLLRSDEPTYFAPGDPRPLGMAVFRVRVETRR